MQRPSRQRFIDCWSAGRFFVDGITPALAHLSTVRHSLPSGNPVVVRPMAGIGTGRILDSRLCGNDTALDLDTGSEDVAR